MKVTAEGIELIKSRESCRLKAYQCPAGIWTIGYGHTGPAVHDGWEITQEDADALLRSDLLVFDAAVQHKCPDSTPPQHSAMVDLCYNIGIDAFCNSSVARLHNAEKYAEAAQAFALWNKAGGKILAGLVSRRAAEAAMYLSDCPAENAPTADGEKPLSHSRMINGQAVAGAATAVTAAPSFLPDGTLDSVKEALGTLSDYSRYAMYALVVVTLLGIGLSLYGRYSDRREGRA